MSHASRLLTRCGPPNGQGKPLLSDRAAQCAPPWRKDQGFFGAMDSRERQRIGRTRPYPPTRLDLNPNPRAPRPADPPPRLWSAPPERPARACAAAPSVSPWPAAAARVLPPPPTALPPDAAHSLPPTPGRTVAAACPPGAPGPRRGAPAPPARSPAHPAGAVACHAGHPATAPRPLDAFAPSAAPGGRTGPPGYSATCQ